MNMGVLSFRPITVIKPVDVPENSEAFRRYQEELEKSKQKLDGRMMRREFVTSKLGVRA